MIRVLLILICLGVCGCSTLQVRHDDYTECTAKNSQEYLEKIMQMTNIQDIIKYNANLKIDNKSVSISVLWKPKAQEIVAKISYFSAIASLISFRNETWEISNQETKTVYSFHKDTAININGISPEIVEFLKKLPYGWLSPDNTYAVYKNNDTIKIIDLKQDYELYFDHNTLFPLLIYIDENDIAIDNVVFSNLETLQHFSWNGYSKERIENEQPEILY